MPAIARPTREETEAVIKASAMRDHGAKDFTFYSNPQVRGLMVKWHPRTGPVGTPFMAQAGLYVGAADWIGYQWVSPEQLERMARAGKWLARFVSVEWKKVGEKPTDGQEAWAETVRGAGGFATWTDSSDGLAAAMERARAGGDR